MTPRLAWVLPISLAAAGCGTDSCFVPGTRVRTPQGDRPIEDLVVGDAITAYDWIEQRIVVGRVAAVHRALVREVRTIVAGASRLRGVTAAHPIFVRDRADFVACAQLRVGDRLVTLGEDGAPVDAVVESIVAHELAEPLITVVNLTVADAPPSFFADGVLVHNKEPAIQCSAAEQRALRIESAVTKVCVGDRFPVRARKGAETWCAGNAVAPAIFATSDPNLLVVDGADFDPAQAVARGAGKVTLTALHEGASASVEITIEDCATGSDASGGG